MRSWGMGKCNGVERACVWVEVEVEIELEVAVVILIDQW